MNILITSIGTTTAINLFKLLRGKNRIIGTDINRRGLTAGSLLVDEFEQVPISTDENFVNAIQSIVSKHSIDLLIPVHDLEIKAISRAQQHITAKVIIPSNNIISTFSDKLIANHAMAEIGVLTPRIIQKSTRMPERLIKRDRIGVGSKGIQFYPLSEIPNDLIKEEYIDESYFMQEVIVGEEYTVDVASDPQGVPFLIIPRKRIEVKSGVATKIEIVKDKELIDIVSRILYHYPVAGFSNIQFIKNNTGAYFIELNYRFGGMSISSALASFNYPELVVESYNESVNIPKINSFPIKWGAYITRYYEEVIHYEA